MTALVERHGSAAQGPQTRPCAALHRDGRRDQPARPGDAVRGRCARWGPSTWSRRPAWPRRGPAPAARHRATCASSTLGLPDGSGIALVADLRGRAGPAAVVLSAAEDPYTVRAAFVAGVRGFLVSSAAGDRPACSRPAAGGLRVPRPAPGGLTGAEGLSGREVEVLQLVADGRSNKEIGELLGLSALTVKSHLARIARKLGTGDRAEMVVVAMRAGVIV